MADNLRDIFSSIANSIRSKKGTTNTIKPTNMSAEIDSISTGTDTSDATATVNDILLGKTAYIGTGKVQGTIPTYDGSYENGVEVTAESCIVNVDDFPLENIDEEKIYGKNIKTNAAILICTDGKVDNLASMMNVECYFVNSLPENPIPISFADELWHIYIMNDIAYVYFSMDESSTPTWYSMSEFWYNLGAVGEGFSDKGFIENESLISEDGVYITYEHSIAYGIKDKQIFNYDANNNEWIDYKNTYEKIINGLLNRDIVSFDFSNYPKISDYSFYMYKKLQQLKHTENITSIGRFSFQYCESLTSINFPNLTEIYGVETFAMCKNLTEVSFPALQEGYFGSTFDSCSNLVNVNLPNLSDLQNSHDMFINCTSLETINLPKLRTISEGMFQGCSNLATITAPVATEIQNEAFSGCNSLTTINQESFPSLVYLRDSSFAGCTNILEVNLPQVSTIGASCFDSCEELTSVSFENALTIDEQCFYYCRKLTEINLPKVTQIYSDTFSSCFNLQNLRLPSLQTIICNNSWNKDFSYCNSLQSIDLGQVSEIEGGSLLFAHCGVLTTIILRNTEKVCTARYTTFKVVDEECYHFFGTVNSTYNPQGLKDGRIYVPDNLVDSYKESVYWSSFADLIVGLSELPEEV